MFTRFKKYLFSGILVVVPLVITFFVLKSLFLAMDNLLRPFLEPVLTFWTPGIGILVTIVVITVVGLLASNILLGRLFNISERLLYKIPIAKMIYSATKQLLLTFSATEKQYFQRVILVEYPEKDIWSVGFVNGEIILPGDTEKKLNILILASINPTSGFFIMAPESKTIPLNIPVEEGMKWVISGGIIKPRHLNLSD